MPSQRISLDNLLGVTTLSSNQSLSVLVQVKLGDDKLGWVDVDWDGSTVGLLLGQLVNLDGEFQSVNRRDLTLLALLGTTDNKNLVLLSDWKSLDLVLLLELLGEWSRKEFSSDRRWGGEVSLSGLRSGGGNVYVTC